MKADVQTHCPVARTAALIATPWTPLILREFMLQGPRRYQDLLDALEGISPNTLSARLKLLEAAGILGRHSYQDHPPRWAYHLTEKGEALRPLLRAMRDWGRAFT